MKTVLFVCAANVCRSPMAEAIFDALAEDAGLPFRARSAGLAALEGAGVAPRAAETLSEIGVGVNPRHLARQVSEEMVSEAELVLTMTEQQAEDLRRLFSGYAGKIHPIARHAGDGLGADVSDPYGHAGIAYRASVRQLLGYMEPIISDLKALAQQPRNEPSR